MRRTRRSAAKNLCGDTRDDDQNEPSSTAAATTLPREKRTLAAIDTLEPNPLVTQATVINCPPKKARKGTDIACAEQLVRMNGGGGDRHRRGQLAPIDNEGKCSNNVSQRSLSSFRATLSSSPATHVPGHLNTDSDRDDISEVDAEDDWFGNPQDVQPGTSASSKVSKARNDERALWQEQDLNPGPTSSPLSAGEVTVVDDINRTQVGNSSAAKDTATVTQPIWPTETDLVYVTGTNKVKLSLQSRLLQAIFKDAFENVRRDLLFEHAFPDAVAIPAVVRKALVSAAEANTFCDGRYNASAAAVHQRLLSHDDYQAKMIRLPRARIPIFRGEVKERCAHLVHVDFFPIESRLEIMRTVDKQLSDYMYTFPTVTAGGVKGLPMRHKPYRNKRIVTAIRTLFFTGGTSAYAHRFDSKFPRFRGPDGALVREVPEAMLALVATALYAAIHEWRTGVHQPTDFSTDAYIDAYNGHVGTLNHLRAQRSGAFHVMMADLYNLASAMVGDSTAHPIAALNLDELDG
ncbi:hypothetical protein V8E52_010847 [Russula decolorans]